MSPDERRGAGRRPRPVARPQIPPGPLHDLKAFLYQLYVEAQTPSIDDIVAAAAADDDLPGAPLRDTVHRLLGDARIPPQQADATTVASVLARMAGWDCTDAATRTRELWVRARLHVGGPSGYLRSVAELDDPFALEVHRSIEVGDEPPGLSGSLPRYVPRDHDSTLTAAVRAAVGGRSTIAVLLGGPSTGKTRACWEAVCAPAALSPEWQLWHPIYPGRPEALLEGLPRVGPHTVLWLNDLQEYLHTKESDLGERAAAGLRELLRDPSRGPVLILGTLWPMHHESLTKDGKESGSPARSQARQLIEGAEILIPDAFTGSELSSIATAPKQDPRLTLAWEQADNGQITQFLAAAPHVLRRYRMAPPGARSLIHTAMDARRMGHGPELSQSLLESAAHGYLNDREWNELPQDWLESALTYCTTLNLGALGIVTRIKPRPGESEVGPRYRLADYLEHAGRIERELLPTPESLWNALAEHSPEGERGGLAWSAQERGLYKCAIQLHRTVPSVASYMSAAQLLRGADRTHEALAYYTLASDAGAGDLAVKSASSMLRRNTGPDAALAWLVARAEAGDATAMREAAAVLHEEERTDEARVWWAHAANANDPEALILFAQSFHAEGREEDARETFRRAAQISGERAERYRGGSLEAEIEIHRTVNCLTAAGDDAEALAFILPWTRRASWSAVSAAADLMVKVKGADAAIAWLGTLGEGGAQNAANAILRILDGAGRSDEAEKYLQRFGRLKGDEPSRYALMKTAERLRRKGQIDDALEAYESAADAACASKGNSGPIFDAVEMLRDAGRLEQALEWLRMRSEAGDDAARTMVAQVLHEQDRVDEALSWMAGFSDAGSADAIRQTAWILWKSERTDEAVAWIEARSAAVGAYVLWEMGEMLGAAGHTEKALDHFERAGNGGARFALNSSVKLLAASGRTADARRLHQFGREPDGRISRPWSATDEEIDEAALADASIPAAEPAPFRVTPRPSDVLAAMKKMPPAAWADLFGEASPDE
ncbi:tetratricopeptide repeat protein [Streptomyces erythrochromogenes]|uniref:tetratricopeptide repeat protein n=1 Tax=Streptomyces erythrochromogenes TaxID=285574 RepID=UPI0038682E78|nr:tetratricopeptide repeat protein [Streptomyces erythrochromogenes]